MRTKDEVAQELIDGHFEQEPELVEVYRFLTPHEQDPQEPIKLLEVTPDTITTGRVDAFAFAATRDTPYPTVIATITPEEMERVRSREIVLPAGWDLTSVQQFQAPLFVAAGH